MATRASLLRDRHDAVLGSGNGAPHEQKIPLRVDLDHAETQLGVPLGAHVARHPLAFDDPGRVGTRADRAGLAVAGIAVGGGTAAEAMAMHHTLKAAALRRAGDLHQLARSEDVHLDLCARRRCVAVDGKDAQDLGRHVQPRLLGVAELGLAGALLAPGPESKLNPTIAHLHHAAGSGLDDRHGNRSPVFREDPRHAELAADQSDGHCYSTLISTSTPAGRSSFVSASMVCGRESLMSMSRLWVRSSNCSRLFLSTCGLRNTVQRSVFTGSGMGPDTCAPVFSAVRTISAAA